jgi:low temperature requirement protein LtrA
VEGLVSTIILVFIAFWLPENFPNLVLPGAYCFGMLQLVESLQGDAMANRRQGSWVFTVGVGLGCLVVIFGLVIGLLMALDA